jgi:CBS domain-containing protein
MLTAKEIMTVAVITVKPEMTINQLAKLFSDHDISGVPVLDAEDRLIGMVTENDLIRKEKKLHIPTVVTLFDAVIYLERSKPFEDELRSLAATQVSDIYTQNPITIEENTPLDEIASLMVEKEIHHLPVVRGKKLVGIVGKKDIIHAIARGEEGL